ncbi:MAG: FKBP-type peptidyl-prolyl cis-trans isomerase [Tannerella sp.]|jgi:peptidylprolyl isomerase/FKBP-type peptidyl-prolyl cis-trans isomerase FklB|nr:FKBP-type peptidyl-prolyl cis-trans isomerase [Tannerella sp.]
MKRYGLYLMMTVAALLAVNSCNKDDEEDHLNEWMIANQQAMNAITSNPEYKEIKSPGNEGSIYYKVLNKGDGKDSIYYTSTVYCYYKGWFVADYPQFNIEKGDVFDQKLFDDGSPFGLILTSTGIITGWKTALYGMVKGDKWEVWIPYQLAYGREGYQSVIPGYSTLVFEIEVMSVDGK